MQLPSTFQIGEEVDVDFMNSKYLKSVKIVGIHFTESKVKYDIEIPVGFGSDSVILEKLDSCFVTREPK